MNLKEILNIVATHGYRVITINNHQENGAAITADEAAINSVCAHYGRQLKHWRCRKSKNKEVFLLQYSDQTKVLFKTDARDRAIALLCTKQSEIVICKDTEPIVIKALLDLRSCEFTPVGSAVKCGNTRDLDFARCLACGFTICESCIEHDPHAAVTRCECSIMLPSILTSAEAGSLAVESHKVRTPQGTPISFKMLVSLDTPAYYATPVHASRLKVIKKFILDMAARRQAGGKENSRYCFGLVTTLTTRLYGYGIPGLDLRKMMRGYKNILDVKKNDVASTIEKQVKKDDQTFVVVVAYEDVPGTDRCKFRY